jgi:hypothetical protein
MRYQSIASCNKIWKGGKRIGEKPQTWETGKSIRSSIELSEQKCRF